MSANCSPPAPAPAPPTSSSWSSASSSADSLFAAAASCQPILEFFLVHDDFSLTNTNGRPSQSTSTTAACNHTEPSKQKLPVTVETPAMWELKTICSQFESFVCSIIGDDFIWNDGSGYKLELQSTPLRRKSAPLLQSSALQSDCSALTFSYIYGSMYYGDNQDDEWLLTYLLFAFSQIQPKLSIQLYDRTDGNYLLIDASQQLAGSFLEDDDHTNSFFLSSSSSSTFCSRFHRLSIRHGQIIYFPSFRQISPSNMQKMKEKLRECCDAILIMNSKTAAQQNNNLCTISFDIFYQTCFESEGRMSLFQAFTLLQWVSPSNYYKKASTSSTESSSTLTSSFSFPSSSCFMCFSLLSFFSLPNSVYQHFLSRFRSFPQQPLQWNRFCSTMFLPVGIANMLLKAPQDKCGKIVARAVKALETRDTQDLKSVQTMKFFLQHSFLLPSTTCAVSSASPSSSVSATLSDCPLVPVRSRFSRAHYSKLRLDSLSLPSILFHRFPALSLISQTAKEKEKTAEEKSLSLGMKLLCGMEMWYWQMLKRREKYQRRKQNQAKKTTKTYETNKKCECEMDVCDVEEKEDKELREEEDLLKWMLSQLPPQSSVPPYSSFAAFSTLPADDNESFLYEVPEDEMPKPHVKESGSNAATGSGAEPFIGSDESEQALMKTMKEMIANVKGFLEEDSSFLGVEDKTAKIASHKSQMKQKMKVEDETTEDLGDVLKDEVNWQRVTAFRKYFETNAKKSHPELPTHLLSEVEKKRLKFLQKKIVRLNEAQEEEEEEEEKEKKEEESMGHSKNGEDDEIVAAMEAMDKELAEKGILSDVLHSDVVQELSSSDSLRSASSATLSTLSTSSAGKSDRLSDFSDANLLANLLSSISEGADETTIGPAAMVFKHMGMKVPDAQLLHHALQLNEKKPSKLK